MSAQPAETEPCGTYAGYQRHKKVLHEPPCDDCRKANSAYLLAYRAANPEYVAKTRIQNAALQRAKTRVAQSHPRELKRAYEQELQRHQEASTP